VKGIFAVDPGGSTGIAWALVDDGARTAVEAMQKRTQRGSTTVTGAPIEQAREIWKLWFAFKRQMVHVGLLDPDNVELIFEDFVLRAGPHAGGRDGTAPERVAYAFEGYRWGRHDTSRRQKHLTEITWQNPSAAARFRKRQLLTEADAWIVGREHERSALSHMLLRVNVLLDQASRRRRAR
jgi:hypothetical protein